MYFKNILIIISPQKNIFFIFLYKGLPVKMNFK